MDKFLAAFLQFLDYCVKAIANYRLTEQGEKEWQDIFTALNEEEPAGNDGGVIFEERENGDIPTQEEVAAAQSRVVFQGRVRK